MTGEMLDEKSIFNVARTIESPDARAEYLHQACGTDVNLIERVKMLLRGYEEQASFLESPALGCEGRPTIDQPIAEGPGTVIGPYKLLQQIGEGGFGVVFMAEQTAPVRRKVALKIIKPGMDTKQVIARFEAERQALAMMDHPNIARVFDAGATTSGRPYFVMELVHGIPVTEYCNSQKLTPSERLRLFIDICRAVQHAHQKGIIHRDLKSSNVMVTMHDDRPVPKIIDFGVSKAISHQLTEKTLFTAFGQMVGTPMYMSPEQAQLSGLDVDTRSDIYSLGVLLYDLVTGTMPFDEATLKRVDFDEMRRMIREEEPLRPSARINTLKGDLLSTVADQRKIDPQKLSQSLRGELDWIVMKCLEKDRNRRYDSANSLAADIERYLNDEPVQACPPSVTYRVGKFMRRHKTALATAGTLVGVLLLAVFGLAVGSLLIWRANNEARRLTYFQRVALAEREWSANNFKRVDELLALCPVDLRGWEWNYVKRLRDPQLGPLQHDNSVSDCAISPDGTQIISLDYKGYVQARNAMTGQKIRSAIRGHESAEGVLCDVVFSTDGRCFATSGWVDVKVWNAVTGEELYAWRPPTKNSFVQAIVFSPSGKLLACINTREGETEHASVWDPMTGSKIFELSHFEDCVLDMAMSPDERLLALGCQDGAVRLVHAITGADVRVVRGNRNCWCVAFSPNGAMIAAGTGSEAERDSGTVRVCDVKSGRERSAFTGHGVQCIAFSPDGTRLATGGTDQTVKLWHIESGQEILTLRGHTDFVQGIAFSPDGDKIVSSGERSIRIWNAAPGTGAEESGDNTITLRGHSDSVNIVTFRPGSGELATASTDGTIKIWNPQTWREERTLRTRFDEIRSLTFSPQGNRLAVSGFQRNLRTPVIILDAETGDVLEQLGEPSGGQALAFGTAGRLLAIGDDSGLVTIFDAPDGEPQRTLQAPNKIVQSLDFSSDERLLAVCHDDCITIWETATGREVDASPLKHRGYLYSLDFSLDGKFLATGGWDRTVRIWETSSWKQVDRIIDATAATQSVAFSPDGQYLAWGATDSAVKLWHIPSGDLTTLRGHLGYIRSVAFSPDGKWLASASEDGTAKVWKVPPDETVR